MPAHRPIPPAPDEPRPAEEVEGLSFDAEALAALESVLGFGAQPPAPPVPAPPPVPESGLRPVSDLLASLDLPPEAAPVERSPVSTTQERSVLEILAAMDAAVEPPVAAPVPAPEPEPVPEPRELRNGDVPIRPRPEAPRPRQVQPPALEPPDFEAPAPRRKGLFGLFNR